MDICLKSMFGANSGIKPTSKAVALEPPINDVPLTEVNIGNIRPVIQNESVVKRSDNFGQTLDKKIKTLEPSDEKTENRQEDDIETPDGKFVASPGTLIDLAVCKNIDSQLSQQMESQISDDSIQLLTNVQIPQDSSFIVYANKPIITEPGQTAVTIPNLEDKSIEQTADQSQIEKEVISDIRTDSGELINETISDNNKVGNENPVKISEPSDSFQVETIVSSTHPNQLNQQSDEKANSKVIIDSETTAGSEQLLITNESNAADSSKIEISNTQFAAVDNQLPNSPQNAMIGQEISTQTTDKTKLNKVEIDQKGNRSKTDLFDLSGKNKFNIETFAKSVTHKMNPQAQPAPQAENYNDLASKQAVGQDIESNKQLLNNIQPAVAKEQAPASITSTKISGDTNPNIDVGSQIQESIQNSFQSGNQQIVIRLNPPELGKVAIKFTEQGNGITGLLQVDKPQTKSQIQQTLPDIIQNLQDCGIQIKKLEVVLTDQQEQYNPKDQSAASGQNGWSEHQSSPYPESQANSIYNEWQPNIDNFIEFTEGRMQFTDNSVNMLV